MAAETASSVIRAALSTDINLTADQLIERVKAAGIKATPESVRGLVYNIRSVMRKKPAPAPSARVAARKIPKPRPAASAAEPATAPAAASAASAPDVSSVLANVALVNRVVGLTGGPENVRQVAEAVQACGGIEAFLQHLELVAGIRASDAGR